MRHLRVMLDANVLVDAQLRDIFLLLAERGLIELRWSAGLLDELREVLVTRMHRQPQLVDRLCTAIARAFPDGEIEVDPALVAELNAPDPGDVHVLAAAIASETDVLVTHDRRGFPPDEDLAEWDLAVLSPATALADLIVHLSPAVVAEVFQDATERLTNPQLDLQAQLHRLEATAPGVGLVIGATLDLPGYRDLLAGTGTGNPGHPPRGTARVVG